MINRAEAERLVELSAELAVQEWMFETTHAPDDFWECDYCVVYLLDFWLEMWIEHDALLRKAEKEC